MGIDLLDIRFRLERQLQTRLHTKHFVLGLLTTVGEVVDLLMKRLEGFEVADFEQVWLRYSNLQSRLKLPTLDNNRSCFGLFGKKRRNRRLGDLIPSSKRVMFWESLAHEFNCPLTPLIVTGENSEPTFPSDLATQGSLLDLMRKSLWQQLQWVPISDPGVYVPPNISTPVKLITLGLTGHWPAPPDPILPREHVWSRHEVREIVRDVLIDVTDVTPEEITDDAELMADLGVE